MKTKHTKGEWKIISGSTPLGNTGDYMPYMEIKNDENQTICYFSAVEDDDDANAKLIAAAPDLLEALIKLNDYFFCEKPLEEGEYEDLINITQNAIKKATT